MRTRIKISYHNVIANIYLLLLRDEIQIKHPKVFRFADKRFRYHMIQSLEIIKKQIEIKQAIEKLIEKTELEVK